MTIVQKYGGTSVGTVERVQAIAERVSRQHRQGLRRIAIVVSAMAGETNRLVDLVKRVNPHAAPEHYDVAVAAGEQVSVGLMAAALEGQGIGAMPFLGYQLGIRTDGLHSKARIRSIDTEKIMACWAQDRIPVVAGFQGVTDSLEITTLGRGGGDTSAVALAVALAADFCEINTDVNGVYTADPRVVPEARLIERMDYETALELSALGSKVLHSRCVELGAKYKLPLIVRSTFDPEEGRSTKIMSFGEKESLEAPVVSGVTSDSNVARVSVQGLKKGFSDIAELFERVAAAGVNVDIIVHDHDSQASGVAFTVSRGDLERAVGVIEDMKAQKRLTELTVATSNDVSKVSAVGLGMTSHSGVASRVLSTLEKKGISLMMISTSEIKISCVVPQKDEKLAVQELHRAFF